jgi:hypothetical protein
MTITNTLPSGKAPTPDQILTEHLAELEDIAKEVGATVTKVVRSRIKVMLYYADPDKDDPDKDIFLDEWEHELEKDSRIFIAIFPEMAAIFPEGHNE